MVSNYLYLLIAVLASLLGAYVSFRYYVHFESKQYSRTVDQEQNRRMIQLSQVSLLISILLFAGLLFLLYNLPKSAAPSPPASIQTPVGSPELSSPNTDPFAPRPVTPLPAGPAGSNGNTPTPGITPGTGFARIGNTNGFGANVRTEPGLEYESLIQLSDGSRVELTGEAQPADGFTWQRVRLEDGRTGWIAENFLIPEP